MNVVSGGWPVIGAVGPMGDGLDQPFWDGLDRGHLLVQRCGRCARWLWGPRWVCDRCHHLDPEWVEVEPVGSVYSWIRTWQPFAAEYARHLPYENALIELQQAGGVRMLGLVVDPAAGAGGGSADLEIGAEVRAFVQAASELTGGVPVLRWRMAPGTRATGANDDT